MTGNNLEIQVSSTRVAKQNSRQLLDDLLAFAELPKRARKKSRGTKSRPLHNQLCSTTSLAIDEAKNYHVKQSQFPKPNNDYGTAITSSMKDKYIFNLNENKKIPCLNEDPQCCGSTSVGFDEYRNNLTKQNEFPKSNNSSTSVVDAEEISHKELMMHLIRSIDEEDHEEHVNLSSSTGNTQMNPIGGVTTIPKSNNHFAKSYLNENVNVNKTQCAEKMTYCRPVVNIYSQQFIYKAIERHAKMQYLVKRLVQAREKEKRNEAWNNYINELKNKHGCNDSRPSDIPKIFATQDQNCSKNDCKKSNSLSKQSDFGDILLRDFCNIVNRILPNENTREPREYEPSARETYKHINNSFCFPTSSSGRQIMLDRERQRYGNRCSIMRTQDSPVLLAERPSAGQQLNTSTSQKILERNNQIRPLKCTSVQTKVNQSSKASQMSEIDVTAVAENETVTSRNFEIVEENLKHSSENSKQKTLSEIENKLDTLLSCVKSFLEEMKSNNCKNTINATCSCCCCDESGNNDSNIPHKTESEADNVTNQKSVIVGVAQEKSENILTLPKSQSKRQSSLDEILNEEMDKSNKIKSDLDKILRNCRSAVKITDDIPTKDNCTELTPSFYNKRQDAIVEEVDGVNRGRMAIAVNTDPLGLLALFQISAETIKQVLAFMPRINCIFNLPRLQIRNDQPFARVSRFVCNICGASFSHPYQLSDHIEKHDFGTSRSCSVCRHTLDTRCHNAKLFPCQHCGQLFTRAYCRQLHEQGCCRRNFGMDARPSLMMLS